jgi:hypothetical protein
MISSNTHPQFFQFKDCPACGDQFQGRLNRQYCSSDCKTQHNNELARERRQEERLITRDYLLNYKLLEKLLQMNGGNPLVIGSKELGFFGFKSEAPSIRTKIDGVLTYVFQDIGIQPSEAEQITRIFRIP